MAVTWVRERHAGRDAERTADTGDLRRQFIVQTDDVRTAQLTILGDARIPRRYSWYSNGGEMSLAYVAKRHSIRQIDNSLYLWEVTVHYEAKTKEDDDEPNPTLRPADYSWSSEQATVDLLVDKRSRKVQNTFGDPFDPGIETTRTFSVLTIERNEASYSQIDKEQYVNTLNAAPIFGYARREGRIDSVNARSAYDPDYGSYWRVTYVMHFRDSTTWVPVIDSGRLLPSGVYGGGNPLSPWFNVVRNIGSRYRRNNTCDRAADLDCVKQASDGGFQSPLGVDLHPTDHTKLDPGTDPYWNVFEPFETKSWTPLGLE